MRALSPRAVLALFLVLPPASLAAAPDPPPQRQAWLLRLLRQDCGSCHGLTLRGGLGPPLRPERLAGRDPEDLARIILDGIPGTPMPPWRFEISPAEARWLAERLVEGLDR